MPGMGKASAATVAAHCRASFPNIRLALVVGICGIVPFRPDSGEEIVLGDVVVSNGVVQYDLGRRLPDNRFAQKDTLLDALGRPSVEIRTLLAKLKTILGREKLQADMARYMELLRAKPGLMAFYPGTAQDRLFEAAYRHVREGVLCEDCGCNGGEHVRHGGLCKDCACDSRNLVRRARLESKADVHPAVHFGLVGSGDTVMKSGEDRDFIARSADVLAFEMEGAGVWDIFPCVVIKGGCDYADSHKTKTWQRYAAATAAACMKAFLHYWEPSLPCTFCLSLVSEYLLTAQQILHSPPLSWRSPPVLGVSGHLVMVLLKLGNRQAYNTMLVLVPYPQNDGFVGRAAVLHQLQQLPIHSNSQARAALYGLGGIG